MISPARIEKIQTFLRQPWVIAVALAICFAPWFITRIEMLYIYQTPPAQTIHPNYFTFHEMSQSWNEGNKLGVIDLNRMYQNSHRLSISDYNKDSSPQDNKCMYMSLDPGLAIIITAARAMFPGLPDSYLRLVALQVILDGMMMFALFLTFFRMGLIPATVISLGYATNTVFAYNAIFPFQYFWEGWLVGASILALIWARRGILAKRRWAPLFLIMLSAATIAFTLWVRSSALVVAIAMILAFLSVPSLRRYYGVFFLVFALSMAPQIVRASSAAANFALSTRMSWHTAYQALGRYPNKYGLEDDDFYVFTKAQNEDGVKYDYCDYRAHDKAIEKNYLDLWHQDPGFIMRSIAARITNGLLYNSDLSAKNYHYLALFVLAFITLLWAVRLGGETLFVSGLMALVYLGYCMAVGIVYSMGSPYAYVAQLALLYFLPVFAAIIIRVMQTPRALAQPIAPGHVIQKTAFWGLAVILVAGTLMLQIPAVKTYLFPQLPYQDSWIVFGPPNRNDNKKLTADWEALPKAQQQKFLQVVHHFIPAKALPDDVSHYFATFYTVVGYSDMADKGELKTLFTLQGYGTDSNSALQSVFTSIQGLKASEISIIKLSDQDTWDGRTIHVKLLPTLERVGVNYQHLVTQKFNRYNYDVAWQGPNEFTAHHRGWGCDALRYALAIYYGGNCPYDPRTGPNPYDARDPAKSPAPKH